VAASSGFSAGADGSTTLDNDIHAGDAVIITGAWRIIDNSAGPGQDTIYGSGLTQTFSASTTVKPAGAANVSVAAIANCSLLSASTSCPEAISFPAPATPGSYQVTVTPATIGGSNGTKGAKILTINFTVVEIPVTVQPLDTQLTLAKTCVLLNQGEVPLSATLKELLSQNPVVGANIDFYIDPALDINGEPTSPSVGFANTGADGLASLNYNINGLSVGDYNLYAEYAGDSSYNPSNDSDTLGVSYVFAGFRQPINADGTSIFGGRVIPIKIKLVDANGVPVTDAAPTVWLTSYDKDLGLGEVLEQVTSVSSADTGNIMRYSPDDQQYIYNWDAQNLANGTYGVVVDLGDSAACSKGPYYAIITVAKKGKK